MTQDERWQAKYKEVVDFIDANKRNPSKHRIEEHDMLNWLKANRKVLNAGKMKAEDAYRTHGDLEVRDMVEFFRYNTPEYLDDLFEKVLHGNSGQMTQEDAFRLFMGAEWDSKNYLDRPLSQLKKDVFSQLLKDVSCIKAHNDNE